MRLKLCLIIISYLCTALKSSAQRDTVVDGITYNSISYYSPHKPKELGNYKPDTQNKIKHGAFILYDEKSEVAEKGTYRKNKKQGWWVEKAPGSNDSWQGNYKHNKRTGEWYCFNRKYLYKNGKLKRETIASYN